MILGQDGGGLPSLCLMPLPEARGGADREWSMHPVLMPHPESWGGGGALHCLAAVLIYLSFSTAREQLFRWKQIPQA